MKKNGDGWNREEVEKVKKWEVLRDIGESFSATNTLTEEKERQRQRAEQPLFVGSKGLWKTTKIVGRKKISSLFVC